MRSILRALTLLILLLAVAGGLVLSLRTGGVPAVEIRTEAPAIGARTAVVVRASAPGRGLTSLRLDLVQGNRTFPIAQRRYQPLPPWAFGGMRTETDEIRAEVGAARLPDLQPGEAVLRATAGRAATWLLHPGPVVAERRLPVRLVPPELSVLSTQNYVSQGGAGVVVYRAGATSVRDGVQAGQWFFPGAPLEGGREGERFCLFGVPWDVADEAAIRLIAEDDVGNRAEAAFVDRFFPKPPKHDRIELDEGFMARVVPAILSQTPDLPDRGSLLGNYLQVNRDLRRRNAEELKALAGSSEPRFLWSEPFLPLPNAQVMSSFADHRTYFYRGREVDRQVHLGYDLAAVAHTPVPAANRGVVRMARYFGIYGNAVVLDHGYGLMTLYGHLSSIAVKEGETVERGQIIGHTGATGLAGGDHLHFTTLVGGLPVNPTEWWDAAWIRDRVARKLGPALPFRLAQGDGARPDAVLGGGPARRNRHP
jgi:murein DD-endopeptidase MepM/ murein hydrolase activator NlpD